MARFAQIRGSRLLGFKLFFNFLNFLAEGLIEQAGAFFPGFALGLRLRGVGRYFAAVDFLVTLFLTLKFCAQFVFRRHSVT